MKTSFKSCMTDELSPKCPLDTLVKTISSETRKRSDEELIREGAEGVISLLIGFIQRNLSGDRGDTFSKGQDDGLRWVLDEINYIQGGDLPY